MCGVEEEPELSGTVLRDVHPSNAESPICANTEASPPQEIFASEVSPLNASAAMILISAGKLITVTLGSPKYFTTVLPCTCDPDRIKSPSETENPVSSNAVGSTYLRVSGELNSFKC